MDVETKGTDSREWPAWTGDVERLARVVNVVGELIAEPVETPISGREREATAEDGVSPPDNFSLEMVVGEDELGVTHTGHPNAVLDRIDPIVVKRVSISAKNLRSDRVQLDFSKEGCTLQVSGDPGWVRKTTGTLANEIQRSVPRWSWLRSNWGGVLYFLTAALGAFIVILPTLPFVDSETGKPLSALGSTILTIILCGVLGLGGLALLYSIARKLLPGFELLLPGRSDGKGAKIVAFLGTQLVALLLLLLNRLL